MGGEERKKQPSRTRAARPDNWLVVTLTRAPRPGERWFEMYTLRPEMSNGGCQGRRLFTDPTGEVTTPKRDCVYRLGVPAVTSTFRQMLNGKNSHTYR